MKQMESLYRGTGGVIHAPLARESDLPQAMGLLNSDGGGVKLGMKELSREETTAVISSRSWGGGMKILRS
jgi:hypothetical protein